MAADRLRIALVGCGQIADAHLQEINKLECAEAVAVCDRHRDLARQAAARFEIDGVYDHVAGMLADLKPDVVHITTPAQTHAPLAIQALEAGCHVYVEKPFAVSLSETESVLERAAELGRLVCLGHDQLFDPTWVETKQMVEQDVVGQVCHVESVLAYPPQGNFGSQVLADPNHWVRQLPGGLFQNTISHPLYRITEFLEEDRPQVRAQWFAWDDGAVPQELRVQLRGRRVTGSLTFLTRTPPQRQTRIYGENGWLEVDLDAQSVIVHYPARLPGAFSRLELPWRMSKQWSSRKWKNLGRFLKAEIHYFAGMRCLFEKFYQSILHKKPSPISEQEIRRHAWLMDEIIRQCNTQSSGSQGKRP